MIGFAICGVLRSERKERDDNAAFADGGFHAGLRRASRIRARLHAPHFEQSPALWKFWPWPCYSAPMERDEAIACLKQHEPELKQLGIERLFLFGSVARNEAREDSDVDLFFDYQKGRLDLFDLMDIKERASTILGRRADIMTRDSIHRMLRLGIEQSAVPVF